MDSEHKEENVPFLNPDLRSLEADEPMSSLTLAGKENTNTPKLL